MQGPAALDVLQPLTGVDLAAMKYYWFAHGEVASVRATVSRTGYTGEDGFEIFVPPQSADRVWQAILEAGQAAGVDPVRPRRARHAAPRSGDAPLRQRHRRDDDRRSKPTWLDRRLEEGRLHRRRRAARAEGRRASPRKLVGFEMLDRGIARHGYDVYVGGAKAGVVTSGTQTPFLKKAIGMAYLPIDAHGAAAPSSTSTSAAAAPRARGRADAVLQDERSSGPRQRARHRPGMRSDDGVSGRFKYTKDHEWIELAGDRGKVGITDYAQQQLGDVVYVELPEVGAQAEAGAVVRHDRVGQGGVRAVLAGHRRSRRGQHGAQGQAGSGQHGSARQLDDRRSSSTNPAEAGALLDADAVRSDLVK